jgi:hypothetical protein
MPGWQPFTKGGVSLLQDTWLIFMRGGNELLNVENLYRLNVEPCIWGGCNGEFETNTDRETIRIRDISDDLCPSIHRRTIDSESIPWIGGYTTLVSPRPYEWKIPLYYE